MKYLWLLLLSPSLVFANVNISASNALVVDIDTNEVLYQKNPDDIKSIASITKLMTALIIMEARLDMDEKITLTDEDVEHTKLRGARTKSNLPVGVAFTRAELMHFMLMNSQNMAAAALARTYPGGYDVFVATMNHKAGLLKMHNTLFVDSCGLQPENTSTAFDLAILAKAAAEYPDINDFSTSPSFKATGYYRNQTRTFTLGTTNRLVMMRDWDIILQKTGFTNAAGNCMVLLTTAGARKVAIIVLDSAGRVRRGADVSALRYFAEHNIMPDRSVLQKINPYKLVRKAKKRRV
jgi:D-alanyl-D-alanine endopeptidase (penicillin-binding protein 7)